MDKAFLTLISHPIKCILPPLTNNLSSHIWHVSSISPDVGGFVFFIYRFAFFYFLSLSLYTLKTPAQSMLSWQRITCRLKMKFDSDGYIGFLFVNGSSGTPPHPRRCQAEYGNHINRGDNSPIKQRGLTLCCYDTKRGKESSDWSVRILYTGC